MAERRKFSREFKIEALRPAPPIQRSAGAGACSTGARDGRSTGGDVRVVGATPASPVERRAAGEVAGEAGLAPMGHRKRDACATAEPGVHSGVIVRSCARLVALSGLHLVVALVASCAWLGGCGGGAPEIVVTEDMVWFKESTVSGSRTPEVGPFHSFDGMYPDGWPEGITLPDGVFLSHEGSIYPMKYQVLRDLHTGFKCEGVTKMPQSAFVDHLSTLLRQNDYEVMEEDHWPIPGLFDSCWLDAHSRSESGWRFMATIRWGPRYGEYLHFYFLSYDLTPVHPDEP